MKLTPPGLTQAPERGLFNEGERKRIKWLVFAFLLVLISFAVMLVKENNRRREARELAREQAPAQELRTVQVTPEIDARALRELARDGTPEERVLIEPKALAQALRDTTLISDMLFEPMGGAALDAQACVELAARSLESRGRLFRAWGTVDFVRRFDAVDGLGAHLRGRLALEDGGHAYFAVQNDTERGMAEGDFVRVDGVFVKNLRQEAGDAGGWVEAPLIVGPRAVRSWPRMGTVSELDPDLLANVEDDSLSGITGQPFFAYWELVGYVKDLPEGAVDWSQAPVLDRETMHALAQDGERFRGRPFRIPVSQIMDSWILSQRENPLRLERMTEGWIGNEKWIGPTKGVIQYVSPFVVEDIQRRDEVLANGFFLKHLAYEPSKADIAIAPFFVLHSMHVYTPQEDRTWQALLLGFAVLMVVLGGIIYVLLRRDRRRSAELQDQLRARRRARQQAHAST